MLVVPSSSAVGSIGQAFSRAGQVTGESDAEHATAFLRFADDLAWQTEMAHRQHPSDLRQHHGGRDHRQRPPSTGQDVEDGRA